MFLMLNSFYLHDLRSYRVLHVWPDEEYYLACRVIRTCLRQGLHFTWPKGTGPEGNHQGPPNDQYFFFFQQWDLHPRKKFTIYIPTWCIKLNIFFFFLQGICMRQTCMWNTNIFKYSSIIYSILCMHESIYNIFWEKYIPMNNLSDE